MATAEGTPVKVAQQGDRFDPTRYLAEPPPDCVVVREIHVGEPIAKQRARLGRQGRVYTPGSTKDHQGQLAALATAHTIGTEPDAVWAYGIRAVFYVQTHQRKDVDNMLKTVLDAMNRIVFKDDSQVKELMGWSVLDMETPRTEFVVYRMHKIERAKGRCVRCGKEFRQYRSWKARLYCSRACNTIANRKGVEVTCEHCGRKFVRIPSQLIYDRVYCSHSCKSLANRREMNCCVCSAAISRPTSWSRPDQTRFFCSKECTRTGRTGERQNMTAEAKRASILKGWATKKATNPAAV